MNHGFEIAVAKEAFHPRPIRQVKRKKPEAGTHAELSKPRILEPGVVIVVQVVDTNHLKPLRQKPLNKVRANKTSSTGDQNSFVTYLQHFSPSLIANG